MKTNSEEQSLRDQKNKTKHINLVLTCFNICTFLSVRYWALIFGFLIKEESVILVFILAYSGPHTSLTHSVVKFLNQS